VGSARAESSHSGLLPDERKTEDFFIEMSAFLYIRNEENDVA
jgi:hypothetical protein